MINAVSANDTASAAQAMKQATGMNKDDFLKLFVTQLQNQDPLNPMNGTDFIGQLAQLTQVEQAYNTNSNLEKLIAAQNSGTVVTAVSLIGSEVAAPGNQVALQQGEAVPLTFNPTSAADRLELNITGPDGAVVRTINLGQTGAGENSLVWDGMDDNGLPLPEGIYNFAVTGFDAFGNSFPVSTLVKGNVVGVNLEGAEPVLNVGGIQVPFSAIYSVKGVS